ncbi:hypothetical protein FJV83_28570 [Mesorhizobium sp. WSM4307]|uniref:hypothetical protein n=1 Tax=unclassified Mesorhizobium TaxID=325217 RepID=UPI000BB0BE8F|nr:MULTISPECIES: hypothetical protein [unclassified Mesorhizobium]PBC18678.1 hypothetical protein CK226_33500 [Mesorhizobium sp. WSM4311]TRC70976.1 hypothetical protein FJV80_33940 [Mesorhizobium sp. WSM4310]TRC78053.1 hypothetical protein FJV81_10815 [Mesorhizobium sp. WSM4315]TRC79242.1 hypothetical protein FJV83_28570 [Mesorhizobium sp. WSM4307]TRC92651.1 hypothetical protein FJV82_32100 [Mesorhizobium sp. WSM4305]
MIVAQMINDFVTLLHPGAVCDRCIAEALRLSSHAHAAQTTEALGTTSDFARYRGRCVICDSERTVTIAREPKGQMRPAKIGAALAGQLSREEPLLVNEVGVQALR